MTSVLNEKYKQSLAAAELLKNTYYSSTVNRSYYGCFQFILDILFSRLNVKREDFEVQRRQNRDSTHGWASKLIENELGSLPDKEHFKLYQKYFPEFQKLRNKADYSDVTISQEEAIKSIRTAETIISIVNKNVKKK